MSGPVPYFSDDMVTLHLGDCLDVLAGMEPESVDAVVTDPPYGLEFMGREWDSFKPSKARIRTRADGRTNPADGKSVVSTPESYTAGRPFQSWCEAWARECLRVLKPGGHLVSFGGTRTYHRLACAIEDAGFEIRDSLHWIYAQGFPKGKACLKPAHEPIVLARKPDKRSAPLPGLDACRVAHASAADLAESEAKNRHADFGSGPRQHNGVYQGQPAADRAQYDGSAGRWPPNVLFAHSADCRPMGLTAVRSDGHHPARRGPSGYSGGWDGQQGLPERKSGLETVEAWDCAPGCPVAELDRQSGVQKSGIAVQRNGGGQAIFGGIANAKGSGQRREDTGYGDEGGASRYFPVFRYEAKADASERPRLADGTAWPTVKPVPLMRWIVRLVTPPRGKVLDLFAGSGTTGEACVIEGFPCVLIEQDPVAAELITTRLRKPIQPDLFGGAA